MMNRFTFYTLVVSTLLSPLAYSQKEKKPDPALIEGKATLERLEQVSNWTSLFNGKDLTNWQGDTERYVVENGVLVCQAGGKVLETEKQYSDFVFKFELQKT